MSRLATFWRGLRTIRPHADFDLWRWGLGFWLDFAPGLHFDSAGIAIGPLELSLEDTD